MRPLFLYRHFRPIVLVFFVFGDHTTRVDCRNSHTHSYAHTRHTHVYTQTRTTRAARKLPIENKADVRNVSAAIGDRYIIIIIVLSSRRRRGARYAAEWANAGWDGPGGKSHVRRERLTAADNNTTRTLLLIIIT